MEVIAQQRVKNTFLALGLGIGVTAFTTRLFYFSGGAEWLLSSGRWTGLLVTIASTTATLVWTKSVPSSEPLKKLAAFTSFNASIGFAMSPIMFLGGPIVSKAALYTAGLAGSLSFIGVCAPSQKFFFLGAPLSMGLTSVALASFMSSMIPGAELVHSFSLYGGLVVFGGYLLLDANTLNTRARNVKEFDPVDECIHLYLDIANLFVRVLEVLVDQKREEEKKKREKSY